MTESFNVVGTSISGDHRSFIFDLMSLILKHQLSQGVFCEELHDCLQTKDSLVRIMN